MQIKLKTPRICHAFGPKITRDIKKLSITTNSGTSIDIGIQDVLYVAKKVDKYTVTYLLWEFNMRMWTEFNMKSKSLPNSTVFKTVDGMITIPNTHWEPA